MLKNILLQFIDLCNMTCVYCRVKNKLCVCIKTTPSCIHKKKLKLCFCVSTRITSTRISESLFPSKISTLERQLNSKIVCNNVPLTVLRFDHNALSPVFSGAVSSLNLLEAPSLLREYLIVLFMIFKP